MKKGKVFGKSQVIAVAMVLCLGGAVWLNMKFSSKEKYLGEATLVNSKSESVVETNAKVKTSDTDYFESAKKEREEMLEEASQTVEEIAKGDGLSQEDKDKVIESSKRIASRIESANNIESLLKAKGFEKCVAVIGENEINIVVKSDGLTTAQTMQIQDIVTKQTDINLANIKIVTVK